MRWTLRALPAAASNSIARDGVTPGQLAGGGPVSAVKRQDSLAALRTSSRSQSSVSPRWKPHVFYGFSRDSALAIAYRMPGVKNVVSEIKVSPVSMFDDNLRRRTVRALYGG